MTDRHDVVATMRTARTAAAMLKAMLDDERASAHAGAAVAICAELRLQTTLLAHVHGFDLAEAERDA